MEAEERPAKKRRLSDQDACEPSGLQSTRQDEIMDDHEIEQKIEANGDATADISNENIGELELKSAGLREGPTENALPAPGETAPLANASPLTPNGQPMSKNQQKKIRKKQEWESKRPERKAIRKEKLVAKRERKKAEKQRQAEEHPEDPSHVPEKKWKQKPVLLPITSMIDCDFDDLMRDNERISLAAQITRSYSDNRKSLYRAHLAICSFGGMLKDRFDNVLSHYKGWKGVSFVGDDFVEASEQANEWMKNDSEAGILAGTFTKLDQDQDDGAKRKLMEEGEVVYLTSEADETLTELKPYSTYIIGGLVDKNREKGICYKRATQRGVKTARLPIGEFMDMQSRKVLATNHVNEIMLKWLECGDWGEAFMKVIPKRKGGKLKDGDVRDEQVGEDEEQDDEAVDDDNSDGGVDITDQNE